MKKYFYNFPTVAFTLVLYGILFIVVENNPKFKKQNIKRFEDLSYSLAFYIGCFQVLSLIPGTSRSGATILGALILGLSRSLAAEFSFFMSFSFFQFFILILGMFVAFVVSVMAIKMLMRYIKKHDFKVFGYYRIVLGVILILYYILH